LGSVWSKITMTRVVTKIGDVFLVKLDDNTKKYFQYIANDLTQLNADLIKAFKKSYPVEAKPELSDVVNGEVEFYAHCVVKWGVKLGLWEKAGKAPVVDKLDVLFRGTSDSGSKPGEQVKVSSNWYVWKINEPFQRVGKLEGANKKAEIGVVVNPYDIVHRMRTGEYDFFYPGY